MKEKNLAKDKYSLYADKVKAVVRIKQDRKDYVPRYEISYPEIKGPTSAVLSKIKEKLLEKIKIEGREVLDPKVMINIRKRFLEKSRELIKEYLPNLNETKRNTLAGRLIHQMFGLGSLELLLKDDSLEEIVINSAKEPVWVYHKEFGWLKTDIYLESEGEIYNYASIIGRQIGRQITNLHPLLDAHLITGDRVNSTLFPISTHGNTITIRKFARSPWTIVHFIDPKFNTLSKEVAALLWLAIQYELSMIIAGGTASGKTSLLNSLTPFIPPTHRIVSIEDTRELNLPEFLHWVPLTTREPNPEGKGQVSMLNLMVNSLRMRPDRIIVGEIRRQKQAEVLFEAMHTGHSVYSTLHANTAEQMKRRMVNPPINLPESMLEALHLTCVQFRHRKYGIRRTFQLAEVLSEPSRKGKGRQINMNVLYRWDAKSDKLEKFKGSVRLFDEIKLHTGLTDKEIQKDIEEKKKILQWMLDNNVKTVNTVGKVVADYYRDRSEVLDNVNNKRTPKQVFTKKLLDEMRKMKLIK